MQRVVLVVVITCLVHLAYTQRQSSCDPAQGTAPFPVYNSAYVVLRSGEFCCPLLQSDSHCIPEDKVACNCQGGLVYEPCHHCKTCAKVAGDLCGGAWGMFGRCDKGLVCTADEFDFQQGKNVTGICVRKEQQDLYQPCGGPYGFKGRCKTGLTCTASASAFMSGADVSGMCLDRETAKKNCFKVCADKKTKKVCGSDGRFYDNICYLRQQNCPNPPMHVVKEEETICNESCHDIIPPSNGRITFSNGVRLGSTATITCNHGYSQYSSPSTNTHTITPTLLCAEGVWLIQTRTRPKIWSGDLPECKSERDIQCSEATNTIPERPDDVTTAMYSGFDQLIQDKEVVEVSKKKE